MHLVLTSFVFAALASGSSAHAQTSQPDVLPYREGRMVPEGYEVQTQIRPALLFGGLATFGATYATSVWLGADSDVPALYVPVFGPFIAVGSLEMSGCDYALCDLADSMVVFAGILLVADALTQIAGLVMMTMGAIPREVLVRTEPPPLAFGIAPSSEGATATLSGTF
jgi:hypothetical protein